MKTPFLYAAWIVALIGLLISIGAEVWGMVPCRLCWYQRIALFPLVWILGYAVYKDDVEGARYALGFVAFGAGVATLQVIEPILPFGDALCGASSCQEAAFFSNLLPFPVVSLVGFLCIGGLLILNLRAHPSRKID
jgi:disulfide bond formation protein DsbB